MENYNNQNDEQVGLIEPLTRRRFIQGSSALMAVPFLAANTVASTPENPDIIPTKTINNEGERVVSTCSSFDCGGKCDIRAHVKEGVVTRISTRPDADLDEEMPIMRACVRGRSYRKFVYHPNRLKYPMKRVGKRGEGRFERISWEEATTLIASNMQRINEQYGPASRFVSLSTGVTGGIFSGANMLRRLFNITGGFLENYHSVSNGNTMAVTPYTYGTSASGSTLDTLENTPLVILWGHNPNETIFGHSNHYFQKMKKNGTKFIVVDPRYSDTASSLADQWIPILPTTDNAMMDAMMYVIISENRHDQAFIDKYTVGFDEHQMPDGVPENESLVAYLMGKKDGVVKTPEWAEPITKVPADTIRQLAREYAGTKPAALMQGWGPQRHICGERSARGATLLATITGNVGVKGGWAAGYGMAVTPDLRKTLAGPSLFENPVKAKINITNWVQACEDKSLVTPNNGLKNAEKLDTEIKMIFSLAGNYMTNQNPDILHAAKVLEDESKVEFIVYSDLYMTPSAKYADILLPETSFLERWNVGGTWGTGNYIILSEKVIEPEFERRSDYEWLCEVAEKLGVGEKFSEGRTEKQWIEHLVNDAHQKRPEDGIPTFDELLVKRRHLLKHKPHIGHVAFEKNINDIEKHPFETPSGKIEIFSKRLYERHDVDIPALSHYVPAIEGPEDALTTRFPLQLITWKGRNRANSTQFANPWLQEVQRQELWINPIDAKRRNIVEGDYAKVNNDRGVTQVPVKITQRIMPGVVALQAGAWWQPDENGIDQGGCANVLTSARSTAMAHGNAHQTLLVEVTKA
ncbi:MULTISPECIES: DMSO/selenate family reductase complex A subunit [Providencia]|uniref:DMSO/selenate family reductase complex A subunit n=1 Tax=Providencia TaxID=586 RepID=UPI00197EF6A3|nr:MULTISPECIES: DMSO/selenate family reductase complex A subunit [Providencia]MBN4866887.1 molybdopterin-dependent oxidoreductase [Providencia stuartii]MBN4876209.1 molybdopterin-dependent oxidoreductase [Providencia stuartii]MBN4880901.1 molybdopterin-dependent oxidoreductase [Providencia stuartii]MBN4885409.1 molybdopterin-dependent oxidoreductase [Providencia stuartii]